MKSKTYHKTFISIHDTEWFDGWLRWTLGGELLERPSPDKYGEGLLIQMKNPTNTIC